MSPRRHRTKPTERQQQCYDFIANYIASQGHAPKLDEIRWAMGGISRGNVHGMLSDLRRLGLLTWKAYSPRSIVLTNSAPNNSPHGIADVPADVLQACVGGDKAFERSA